MKDKKTYTPISYQSNTYKKNIKVCGVHVSDSVLLHLQ